MNAAGARLLKQMAFSFSSDGVNINRGRALWHRCNTSIVVCSAGAVCFSEFKIDGGTVQYRYHTLRIGEPCHNMVFTLVRMFSLSAFFFPPPSSNILPTVLEYPCALPPRRQCALIYFCGTSLGGVFVLW